MNDRKIRNPLHFSVPHFSVPIPAFRACVAALFAAALFSLPACAQNDRTPRAQPQSLTPAERELLRTFVDEFVPIRPGTGEFPKSFEMGSRDGDPTERPAHTVTFDYEFAIARYEVPQNLYQAVMRRNPSVWQGPGRERNACEMMTWQEAAQFCQRVTQLLRAEKLLDADEIIRLPSEAEWEYCCRAGSETAYSFGDAAGNADGGGTKRLDEHAWHTGNAAGNDPSVGVLKPNAWGLYDMHGYLWEYVQDVWHDGYDGAPADGSARDGTAERGRRVIRGGSWRDAAPELRSATRWPIPDHVRSDAIGFRCVRAGSRVK